MLITLDIEELRDAEELLAKRVAKLEAENAQLREQRDLWKEMVCDTMFVLNQIGEVYEDVD